MTFCSLFCSDKWQTALIMQTCSLQKRKICFDFSLGVWNVSCRGKLHKCYFHLKCGFSLIGATSGGCQFSYSSPIWRCSGWPHFEFSPIICESVWTQFFFSFVWLWKCIYLNHIWQTFHLTHWSDRWKMEKNLWAPKTDIKGIYPDDVSARCPRMTPAQWINCFWFR